MDDYRAQPNPPCYSVTNENWRGKNDPTERRRIQNRLNQRAFRQRQREGETPKQYKPRSNLGGSSSPQDNARTPSDGDDDDNDDEDDDDDDEVEDETGPRMNGSPHTPTRNLLAGTTHPATGRCWDELAQLINRNLMQAAYTNARHLGIEASAIQIGASLLTPRSSNRGILSTLQTIKLQHEVAHDPIIDIIPHPRLRFNILKAIAARQMDAAVFSSSLRASGALENVQGQWLRGGLVVWSSPDQLASWELSELFVRQWAFLLQGCEDLLATTNSWRGRRGERLFPSCLNNRQ